MKKKYKWSSVQLMIFGFLLLILFGSLILQLPICNQDGKWLPYVDALFTSTTSACVTGLMTVTTATQFTLIGKIIILFLIQVGGWGVLVCAAYLMVLLNKRIKMSTRVILQDLFGLDGVGGIVRIVIYIIKATVVVEALGAFFYSFQFIPQFGLVKGIGYSIFHSISAYCNAGIDLLGSDSLAQYVNNPYMNFVTCSLIVLGGIGFLVYQDIVDLFKNILIKRERIKTSLRKCKLQTKLALSITGILLLAGTILVYVCEYDNPDTIGNMSFAQQIMCCFFQSVTTRTAGFFTIDQTLFKPVTQFICCIFMFIGGSPLGTAGGIKTVTIGVIFLTWVSILKGNNHVTCFKRSISLSYIRVAVSVFVTSLFLSLIGVAMLMIFSPNATLNQALYEVFSATATVGLTAGLTSSLTYAGKWIVIVLMYMGRIGPVTLPVFFMARNKNKGEKELPNEHILVG